jgi:hypothetical protein
MVGPIGSFRPAFEAVEVQDGVEGKSTFRGSGKGERVIEKRTMCPFSTSIRRRVLGNSSRFRGRDE